MNFVMETRRKLGDSALMVSPVALGCWPFSGISSLGIEDRDSVATIRQAIEEGVNFIDTAYSYGYDGRSDRVIKEAVAGRWDQVVIASKVGTHYDSHRQRVVDGRRDTLTRHAEEILLRLGAPAIDLLYLHQPDPAVEIEDSAEALARLMERGLVRYVGISNADSATTERFSRVCKIVAHQSSFNMLQAEVVEELRPWCSKSDVGLVVFWVLMKGLLAGAFQRGHQFDPRDRRLAYPMYQGEQWERNQDLLDELRSIALSIGWSVPRLVVRWSLEQPGITSVLVGARSPQQISETIQAMHGDYGTALAQQVDDAVARRRLFPS